MMRAGRRQPLPTALAKERERERERERLLSFTRHVVFYQGEPQGPSKQQLKGKATSLRVLHHMSFVIKRLLAQ